MRGSKKNKSFSPIRLYFKALFLSTLIFFVLSTGIVYGFMHFYNKPNTSGLTWPWGLITQKKKLLPEKIKKKKKKKETWG
jgi:hypothetical protein